MAQKTVKLTPELLRKLVAEEASKGLGDMESTEDRAKDTEETDADEYADTLDHHIDVLKAFKVEEARILRRLSQIKEQKRIALKKLARKV